MRDSNETIKLSCPGCGCEMIPTAPDHWGCNVCGIFLEQLTIFNIETAKGEK